MKIANTTSPLIVSDNFDPDASIMGMSQEAALQMARHLRDTIYTNKILAVVREFGVNSNDEHVKFNVDKNVEIGIREIGGQYEFFCRDFAKGLDENGIRTIFGVYGNSTKSKDNNTAGCYGVGSKCGFCYTDSYYVVSHFSGDKTIYTLALGGDEKGYSNGFIYKTHSEPTTESGIEVIVPIKSSDLNKFTNEIKKFVYFSPYKIVANVLKDEFSPLESVFSKTVDGVVIKSLKEASHWHNNNKTAVLQMGGVSYGTIELPEGFRSLDGQVIVVDLPIGSMTIALSRESFHDTPANQNYLNKVKIILQDLADEDFAVFKNKPLKETITENLGELSSGKFQQGSLFQARFSAIYPDVWDFVSNMSYVGNKDAFQKKDSKDILVLIPNNSATEYWKSKLRGFAQVNGFGYYIGCENQYSRLQANGFAQITEIFSAIRVKRIPFPKTKKAKTYAVYNKKYREGSFNAIGFANRLRECYFNLPEETDEQKLKEWIGLEKQKAIDSKNEERLCRLGITVGSPSRYASWSCTSEELAQHVEDLGLFVIGRGEHSKLVQQWAQERTVAQEKQNKIKKALKSWATFHPRTINLVKKEKNADRLNKFWTAVMAETSTRTKIFAHVQSSYDNYWGSKNKLTREELRAILKLQNA